MGNSAHQLNRTQGGAPDHWAQVWFLPSDHWHRPFNGCYARALRLTGGTNLRTGPSMVRTLRPYWVRSQARSLQLYWTPPDASFIAPIVLFMGPDAIHHCLTHPDSGSMVRIGTVHRVRTTLKLGFATRPAVHGPDLRHLGSEAPYDAPFTPFLRDLCVQLGSIFRAWTLLDLLGLLLSF